jgi:hypothetical protein
MAMSTKLKAAMNSALAPLNVRIESLTAENAEASRLSALKEAGHFERAVYSLSPGMQSFDPSHMASDFQRYAAEIERLKNPYSNDVGYIYPGNTFYRTPDMEVLYCLVRRLAPKRIIEVGCGSSTRISRQAIRDGGLATEIIAIDPWTRNDIGPHVDKFIQQRLEKVDFAVFEALKAGDILFIDSSHEIRAGNDCARLFCEIIPALEPGVVVHVHDVFLPFDYPVESLAEMGGWGEQYLLHALLQGGRHELLWPGYYVQNLRPDMQNALPFLNSPHAAQSFWFQVR